MKFFKKNYLIYVFGCFAWKCVCEQHGCLVLVSPRTAVIDGCEPKCGCWDLNSAEQPLFLSVEMSHQSFVDEHCADSLAQICSPVFSMHWSRQSCPLHSDIAEFLLWLFLYVCMCCLFEWANCMYRYPLSQKRVSVRSPRDDVIHVLRCRTQWWRQELSSLKNRCSYLQSPLQPPRPVEFF